MNDLPHDAVLAHGKHATFADGACAMEWLDVLDRRRRGIEVMATDHLTDYIACVCPVVADFYITWNDCLRSDE